MARKPEPPKKPSRITVPDRCHPAAKVVFAEMQRQGVTYEVLSHYSGIQVTTIKAWRTSNRPGLETMEAALGALGWSFLPVPSLKHLPPSVRDGLRALSDQWQDENALLCGLLATVCRAPFALAASPASAEIATLRPRRPRRGSVHPDQVELFAHPQEQGQAA